MSFTDRSLGMLVEVWLDSAIIHSVRDFASVANCMIHFPDVANFTVAKHTDSAIVLLPPIYLILTYQVWKAFRYAVLTSELNLEWNIESEKRPLSSNLNIKY